MITLGEAGKWKGVSHLYRGTLWRIFFREAQKLPISYFQDYCIVGSGDACLLLAWYEDD
jgi:hypothetical protein